jgi:hypothetical protein
VRAVKPSCPSKSRLRAEFASRSSTAALVRQTRSCRARCFPSSQPSPKGAGVGLTLCREIVELHPGRLRIARRAWGRHGRFILASSAVWRFLGDACPEPPTSVVDEPLTERPSFAHTLSRRSGTIPRAPFGGREPAATSHLHGRLGNNTPGAQERLFHDPSEGAAAADGALAGAPTPQMACRPVVRELDAGAPVTVKPRFSRVITPSVQTSLAL